MAVFKGAGVAIVTPMHANGRVNYDKLKELLEYQVKQLIEQLEQEGLI